LVEEFHQTLIQAIYTQQPTTPLDITFLVNFQREKNKKEFEVPGRILS
jgi:hypothetical protein